MLGQFIPSALSRLTSRSKRRFGILRHSFCSYAVAIHGITWTAEQADHSEAMLKKHYREVVTKEDAKKYFSILVSNQHPSPLLGDMKKPTRPRNSETTSPTAKKSVKEAESTTVSAKSTPAENFTKLVELHKTKGPVPFRPTQQDYKRQEKLTSFLYWFDRPPQSSYT